MYYKDSEGNIVYSFKNRERWARDYTKTVWLERCIVLDIPKTEDLVNAAILYVEGMISRTSEDLCDCLEAGYAWGISQQASNNEINKLYANTTHYHKKEVVRHGKRRD